MVCIHCQSNTRVINSRHQRRNNAVWRRRSCQNCRSIFTTSEIADYGAAWLVSSHRSGFSPFSRDKLFLSLYRSCQHRPQAVIDASALTDTVIRRLLPVVKQGLLDRQSIRATAQVALSRFDDASSVQYAAYHKK